MEVPMFCKSFPKPSIVLLQAEINKPTKPTMANLAIKETEENFMI